MRLSVDLTNEAQQVGTREVSQKHVEMKSVVDRPDPVWSFIIFTQNTAFEQNSRHATATLFK